MAIAAIIWAALGLTAAIIELLVLDFTFLLLGIAAGGAAIAAAFGASFWWQLGVFGALAIVSLVAIRPLLRRTFRATRETKTNVDALPGSRAKVLEPVTVDGGLVLLNGEHWTARLDQDDNVGPLPVGSLVHVIRIAGATAVVRAQEASPWN